jgi:hypothetical protein
VRILDDRGRLAPGAIPKVTIVKGGHYHIDEPHSNDAELEIGARMAANLREGRLSGFVAEGWTPYSMVNASIDGALRAAVLHGLPVVMVGRGNPEGFAPQKDLFIGGLNLTATKARLLLMASLMRLGSLPAAADPDSPTSAEIAAIRGAVGEYQKIFDAH